MVDGLAGPTDKVYGTTGATNDIPDLDEPSCSSEQSSAKKAVKSAFPSHKKPKNKLIIDTEIINKMFTYGGEKGELKQEEAMEKLESDICELAAHCVAAMRRVQKKRKSNFQKLLEEAVGNQDDDEGGIDDDELGDGEDKPVMSDENNETENSGIGEDEAQDQVDIGEQLSYESLFQKNKKRPRGDRRSYSVQSGTDCMQLKSMFNQPLSVRGIKSIEIEEEKKQKQKLQLEVQSSGD